jgi:hypothetical protein
MYCALQFMTIAYFFTTNILYFHDSRRWRTRDIDSLGESVLTQPYTIITHLEPVQQLLRQLHSSYTQCSETDAAVTSELHMQMQMQMLCQQCQIVPDVQTGRQAGKGAPLSSPCRHGVAVSVSVKRMYGPLVLNYERRKRAAATAKQAADAGTGA